MLDKSKAMSPSEEKWWDWVDLYHDRFCAVTGIAVDTLYPSPEDFEIPEEGEAHCRQYLGGLWEIYKAGIDGVDAADENLKGWPAEKKPGEGKESADDFRRKWLEHQARMDELGA